MQQRQQDKQAPSPAQTYEDFLVPHLFVPWTDALLRRAAPQPGERVLDLACGTGVIARHVAPLVGVSGRVVAVDISPDMLTVARSIPAPPGAAIEWREGNASELDIEAGAFDLVICQQGLQFFPDRAQGAAAMHRALAAGGRAIIAVWRELERHDVLKALFTAESEHLQLPLEQLATPFSLSGDSELRAILEGAGFRGISIEPLEMDVKFPSADHWVELTVRGGAAVIPELAHDGDALAALLAHVRGRTNDVISRYRRGEELVFPMFANVATAFR
jgi:SAM-dependent methyltransferase